MCHVIIHNETEQKKRRKITIPTNKQPRNKQLLSIRLVLYIARTWSSLEWRVRDATIIVPIWTTKKRRYNDDYFSLSPSLSLNPRS